jgi:hypothetical protein
MNKDKRITTIVLDKEADRKSKIIAEITGMSIAGVYREALNVYFAKVVDEELNPMVNNLEAKLWVHYKVKTGGAYEAVQDHRLSEAAMMIAETLSQLPNDPSSENIIREGIS